MQKRRRRRVWSTNVKCRHSGGRAMAENSKLRLIVQVRHRGFKLKSERPSGKLSLPIRGWEGKRLKWFSLIGQAEDQGLNINHILRVSFLTLKNSPVCEDLNHVKATWRWEHTRRCRCAAHQTQVEETSYLQLSYNVPLSSSLAFAELCGRAVVSGSDAVEGQCQGGWQDSCCHSVIRFFHLFSDAGT